jgi:hypothetical protein
VSSAPASEFAPAAIGALFAKLSDALPFEIQLGGILGDQAHVYGYHRARAVLPVDDYSVVLPRDRQGRPWAAAALDITPVEPLHVQTLCSRLVRAVARRDSRLRPLREFYGTLDGRNVYGFDLHTWRPASSDASHLWHLHLSFHRDVACRASRLLPLADLLAGKGSAPTGSRPADEARRRQL